MTRDQLKRKKKARALFEADLRRRRERKLRLREPPAYEFLWLPAALSGERRQDGKPQAV